MNVLTVNTYDQLSEEAAKLIARQIKDKKNSVLGLATGSTPVGIYKKLISWYNEGELDFSSVSSINLDEYVGLNGDHEQSYRYFMNVNLFDHINIDKNNTFVPNGVAQDTQKECKEYDARIEKMGIDVQLLGIGLDGHIGFNEPSDVFEAETHEVVLDDSTIKANARFFESERDVPRKAVTMGMGGIMKAGKVILVANGGKKKEILRKALFGPITPRVPASILQLHPDLTVIFSEE